MAKKWSRFPCRAKQSFQASLQQTPKCWKHMHFQNLPICTHHQKGDGGDTAMKCMSRYMVQIIYCISHNSHLNLYQAYKSWTWPWKYHEELKGLMPYVITCQKIKMTKKNKNLTLLYFCQLQYTTPYKPFFLVSTREEKAAYKGHSDKEF